MQEQDEVLIRVRAFGLNRLLIPVAPHPSTSPPVQSSGTTALTSHPPLVTTRKKPYSSNTAPTKSSSTTAASPPLPGSVETGGTLCMVGSVGDYSAFDDRFNPRLSIPTVLKFTAYHSSTESVVATPLDEIIELMVEGRSKIPVGKVFKGLHRIVEAHRLMNSNQAGGEIIINAE